MPGPPSFDNASSAWAEAGYRTPGEPVDLVVAAIDDDDDDNDDVRNVLPNDDEVLV
jgi:hypothetical protein